MKVLLVEPSRVVSMKLEEIFRRNDIMPLWRRSGEEGLAALADGDVAMLCFSQELGDMTGIEFFESAKARGLVGKRPSVLISASQDRKLVEQALCAGITEFASKRELPHLDMWLKRYTSAVAAHVSGTVLLVEDSATQARVCRDILEGLGLVVTHCRSAEDAVALLARNSFDLVVTDYMLAGTHTGMAVIHAVRGRQGRGAAVPIIAMSALDDAARKVEILRSGANDFVGKPVLREEFAARTLNLLAMQRLMQRLEAQNQAMQDLAMHDQLTGLFNRHYLQSRVPEVLRRSEEGRVPLSLFLLDIDHFKKINDKHGHEVGDEVLEAVGELLMQTGRDREIAARIGGEEFVVVMPGADAEKVLAKAEALRSRMESLCPSGLAVTASFGVACHQAGETWHELFKRADDAVYAAKDGGRNRVVLAA